MKYSESLTQKQGEGDEYTNGRSIKEITLRIFALRRAMNGTNGQFRIDLGTFWRTVGKRRTQGDR
ncbi:MAG TPA: hypothetical protein VN711_02100 [Candidatus Saccharimonadales bacterium]|nr:hypothetical protein [Candidatus Saccharimonadales bacterium]